MDKGKVTTEPTIRPVFQHQRFTNAPLFFFYEDTGSADAVHDFRPPQGTHWTLNYAYIIIKNKAGAGEVMRIVLNPSTSAEGTEAAYTLVYKAVSATGDTASWGAFGNGPLVLTHDTWLQTVTHGTNASDDFIIGVAVEVL